MRMFIAMLVMVLALPLSAQNRPVEMVSVPASMLTDQQKAQVEAQVVQERVRTYGSWVGVGKEVGEAVNSSLAAITDQTARFADTKAGKFTMFIVVWKVLGEDIVGIVFGFLFLLFGVPVLIWSYHRWTKPYVSRIDYEADGKTVKSKVFEVRYHAHDAAFFHAVIAGFLLIIVCFVVFA